jgi:N-acetylneuraminic acid mutarotase
MLGAPAPRRGHTMIWTGSEMIVWGGSSALNLQSGGRYDPRTDAWRPTSLEGAPAARAEHSAVWTGSEMIVFGGLQGFSAQQTGGRYDPAGNTWKATSTPGAPAARWSHGAVFTGSEMLVWGGQASGAEAVGGRYDPAADSWLPMSTNKAPTARRSGQTAIWTESELMVWGGTNAESPLPRDGARYQPAMDAWTPMAVDPPGFVQHAPDGREGHAAVWTGAELIVWGGSAGSAVFASGGRYAPQRDSWLAPPSTAEAPSPRRGASAVWSGSEMLVWGGASDPEEAAVLASGGRLDPATNRWRPMSQVAAPVARVGQRAVWTGSELIVWGGRDTESALASGGRYTPGAP